MMQVSGRLWEYLATLKMLRPHLLRSSSSFWESTKNQNGLNGFSRQFPKVPKYADLMVVVIMYVLDVRLMNIE